MAAVMGLRPHILIHLNPAGVELRAAPGLQLPLFAKGIRPG